MFPACGLKLRLHGGASNHARHAVAPDCGDLHDVSIVQARTHVMSVKNMTARQVTSISYLGRYAGSAGTSLLQSLEESLI